MTIKYSGGFVVKSAKIRLAVKFGSLAV